MSGMLTMTATPSYSPRAGCHEGDRRPEPRLRAQRGDLTAGLHCAAGAAEQVAQGAHRVIHVVHDEREPPEARGPVPVARNARALGRLHHLEDWLARSEESLARGAARRGALAPAPEVEALRLELLDRPVHVRR